MFTKKYDSGPLKQLEYGEGKDLITTLYIEIRLFERTQ